MSTAQNNFHSDYFSLLHQPRRPWLEVDALKQKFLAFSAETHPDKIHSARDAEKSAAAKKFAELNTAFNCLTDPKTRLLHLLELERGTKPADIQTIPVALADWFAEIATACRQADAFLAEKNQTTSPLLQVRLFARGQDWIEKLNSLQQKLDGLRAEADERLKSLDEHWVKTDADSRQRILSQLEELYRLFGYFNRWQNQIRERVVQLSF